MASCVAAGVVLRAGQRLEDAARARLGLGGAGQQGGRGGGVARRRAAAGRAGTTRRRRRPGSLPRHPAPSPSGARSRRPVAPASGAAARSRRRPEQGAPTITVVPSSSADAPSPPATGLEVRPFRALTYRRRDPEHLARVSSPAYDLVTPAGRDRLADADPHNIVRLILPRVEPADGADERPAAAAAALRRAGGRRRCAGGRTRGCSTATTSPALWLYELQPADGTPADRGWLGAVALPPPGRAAVLPHEDTYAPAVEGRRALLAATAHRPGADRAGPRSRAGRSPALTARVRRGSARPAS